MVPVLVESSPYIQLVVDSSRLTVSRSCAEQNHEKRNHCRQQLVPQPSIARRRSPILLIELRKLNCQILDRHQRVCPGRESPFVTVVRLKRPYPRDTKCGSFFEAYFIVTIAVEPAKTPASALGRPNSVSVQPLRTMWSNLRPAVELRP
jgi:hypothetical protein